MYTLHIIRNKKIRAEIFFEVQSECLVLELIKSQLEFIKKYSIGTNTKSTDKEYTKHIGLLLCINLQYGSTQ